MANPLVQRGGQFTGAINLKMTDGTSPQNLNPYVIPGGAVVEVHFPPDTNAPNNGAPVILSSANALPNPPFTGQNEVVIVNAALGQISFTCIPGKSANMLVGKNQAVNVKVIKDPATTPTPVQVDIFEQVKVIDIQNPANP